MICELVSIREHSEQLVRSLLTLGDKRPKAEWEAVGAALESLETVRVTLAKKVIQEQLEINRSALYVGIQSIFQIFLISICVPKVW